MTLLDKIDSKYNVRPLVKQGWKVSSSETTVLAVRRTEDYMGQVVFISYGSNLQVHSWIHRNDGDITWEIITHDPSKHFVNEMYMDVPELLEVLQSGRNSLASRYTQAPY
jgi:hypothetical protein